MLDYMKGEGVPTDEPWTAPRFWNDSQFNGADYPVVGVTWYETVDGDAGRVIRGGGWFYFSTADARNNFR